ncbi:MAG: hypothetical protein QME60_01110 [Verrucomicrobiota bacterium]|nr:hypothetical protein [Verrucomicrobiota bacterium]
MPRRATQLRMVCREARRFLGVEPSWQPDWLMLTLPAPDVRCDAAGA